jgi:hypothetical protein
VGLFTYRFQTALAPNRLPHFANFRAICPILLTDADSYARPLSVDEITSFTEKW